MDVYAKKKKKMVMHVKMMTKMMVVSQGVGKWMSFSSLGVYVWTCIGKCFVVILILFLGGEKQ